jgi:hypothetical protein
MVNLRLYKDNSQFFGIKLGSIYKTLCQSSKRHSFSFWALFSEMANILIKEAPKSE